MNTIVLVSCINIKMQEGYLKMKSKKKNTYFQQLSFQKHIPENQAKLSFKKSAIGETFLT